MITSQPKSALRTIKDKDSKFNKTIRPKQEKIKPISFKFQKLL